MTYGFSPQQEIHLNSKRKDIYKLWHIAENDIPTALAHPLCILTVGMELPSFDLFEKFALTFKRFEVVTSKEIHGKIC